MKKQPVFIFLLLCIFLTACAKKEILNVNTAEPTNTAEQTVYTAKPSPTPEPTSVPTKKPTPKPVATQIEDNVLSNDDFTIIFPGAWTYFIPDSPDENGTILKIDYPDKKSSISIAWNSDTSFKINQFNNEVAQTILKQIGQALKTEATLCSTATYTMGNKQGAAMLYSMVYNKAQLDGIQVHVPTPNGLYIITLTMYDKKATADFMQVLLSIRFN